MEPTYSAESDSSSEKGQLFDALFDDYFITLALLSKKYLNKALPAFKLVNLLFVTLYNAYEELPDTNPDKLTLMLFHTVYAVSRRFPKEVSEARDMIRDAIFKTPDEPTNFLVNALLDAEFIRAIEKMEAGMAAFEGKITEPLEMNHRERAARKSIRALIKEYENVQYLDGVPLYNILKMDPGHQDPTN